MIDDLFELSRLEAGDLEWSIGQVELAELVDETVAAMRVEAEAKGVAVAAELPPLPRPARADPEKLQRVLFNLIQNAIRHTPADGSVTVRAEPAGDWVEVEVADTGPGIARDRSASASSSRSCAARPPARPAAPGSAWRSRAPSSRRTAAASGSPTATSAPACGS